MGWVDIPEDRSFPDSKTDTASLGIPVDTWFPGNTQGKAFRDKLQDTDPPGNSQGRELQGSRRGTSPQGSTWDIVQPDKSMGRCLQDNMGGKASQDIPRDTTGLGNSLDTV